MRRKIVKRLLLAFVAYVLVSLFLVYDEGLRIERYDRMVRLLPEDIQAAGISLMPGSSIVLSEARFEKLLDAMSQRRQNQFWQKGDKVFGSWFWHREYTIERISEESLRLAGHLSNGQEVHNREYNLIQIRSRPLIWLFLYKEVK